MTELLAAVAAGSAVGSVAALIVQILLKTVFKRARPRFKLVTWMAAQFFFFPVLPPAGALAAFEAIPHKIARLAGLAWLLGAALSAAFLLARQVFFTLELRRGAKEGESARLRLLAAQFGVKTPRIVKSSAAAVPMAGFSAMFFPEGEQTRLEDELVMRHLLAHMTGGDLWLKLLTRAVQVLHWFNPAVTVFVNRAVSECIEETCHERALLGVRPEHAEQYRRLYKEFEKSRARIPPFLLM